jgi:hypothetical protein
MAKLYGKWFDIDWNIENIIWIFILGGEGGAGAGPSGAHGGSKQGGGGGKGPTIEEVD